MHTPTHKLSVVQGLSLLTSQARTHTIISIQSSHRVSRGLHLGEHMAEQTKQASRLTTASGNTIRHAQSAEGTKANRQMKERSRHARRAIT